VSDWSSDVCSSDLSRLVLDSALGTREVRTPPSSTRAGVRLAGQTASSNSSPARRPVQYPRLPYCPVAAQLECAPLAREARTVWVSNRRRPTQARQSGLPHRHEP